MYGKRDSTTKPRQVQLLIVVKAKICPSAATVLVTINKGIETELEFALSRGERGSESSSQVTVAGTTSTLIPWDTGPATWRSHVQLHMN